MLHEFSRASHDSNANEAVPSRFGAFLFSMKAWMLRTHRMG